MTFLQPLLLLGLPLALLPIIIHLIHLYRRRRVKWTAMIFLHAAQYASIRWSPCAPSRGPSFISLADDCVLS